MTSGVPKIIVLARHYSQDDEFWLGYKCKKCGLRFSDITNLQTHSKIHRTKGHCVICKKHKILEDHHYSYKDIEKDKKKNTIRVCNECHGMQQLIQVKIRDGKPQTYIGHILNPKI